MDIFPEAVGLQSAKSPSINDGFRVRLERLLSLKAVIQLASH